MKRAKTKPPARRDFVALANVFTIAYDETHSLVEALKVVFSIDAPRRRRPIIQHPIVTEVAQKHGITVEQLTRRRRFRIYTRPRQEAWWRLRNEARLSYPEIGALHGFDHATVLLGVRAHERRMAAKIGNEGPAPGNGTAKKSADGGEAAYSDPPAPQIRDNEFGQGGARAVETADCYPRAASTTAGMVPVSALPLGRSSGRRAA